MRDADHWRYPHQRQLLSVVGSAVLVAMVFAIGCKSPVARDPQRDYQDVRLAIVRGDLDKAQTQAEAASKYYGRTSNDWGWKFRILQAEVLAYRKQNQLALATLDAPLPPALANGDDAIRKNMVEALALARMDRDPEANVHLERADKLCQSNHSSLEGELSQIHGVIELTRGNLPDAEGFFRKSLLSARQQHDELLEATALLNLGLTALKQEHFDNSILWSSDGYRAAHALGAQFAEQKTLGNLGWAYYRMGDMEKSLTYFQQAADQARKVDARNDLLKWLRALGVVSREMGRTDAALDYFRQSLALAQQSEDNQDLVDALTALTAISVEQQQWDQAQQFSRRAIEQCRLHNDHIGELDAMLVEGEIAAHSGDVDRAGEIFRQIEADKQSEAPMRWEAQHNLAHIAEIQNRPLEALRQYERALATLDNARESVSDIELRLPFLANAAHLQDDYIQFLISQKRPLEALRVADYSRAYTLSEGLVSVRDNPKERPGTIKNPQLLAAHIKANILFYWLGPKHSYLWVATAAGVNLYPLPPSAEINALVQAYRRDLLSPRDVLEAGSQRGVKLYKMLVAPAAGDIERNPRTVVVPDGELNNLNFETLLVPGPKLHYLIEDVTLTNAAALPLVRTSSQPPTLRPRLLLVGDPLSPNRDYAALPNASMEMRTVEMHFKDASRTVLQRDHATRQAYLASNPEQFAYIHFVAHATVSRISPLDSAILLSKSAPDDDSFKLYARDIIGHPLNARLVMLSSCYGAGARAYAGEGLVGLSWAFLRSGAQNVIAALWEASDSATPQLVDHLYSELAQQKSPDVALRSAKLALLHSGSVYRKPLYWAPFQLYSYEFGG